MTAYFEMDDDMNYSSRDDIGVIREIALTALDPEAPVDVSMLQASGLHIEVAERFYAAFESQIVTFEDWEPLLAFEYPVLDRGEPDAKDRAAALTQAWRKELIDSSLDAQFALMMYEGERPLRPGAPPYRLFLLKDGRVLYYSGGSRMSEMHVPVLLCGDIATVIEAVDSRAGGVHDLSNFFFLVLLDSFVSLLRTAISANEQHVFEQKKLRDSLERVVRSIA